LGSAAKPGKNWVLAALLTAYCLNFIDRQIVGILASQIKAELLLTDTQLGLLGGIAFALLYTTLGIPVAALADRRTRSGVIAASLAIWSAFTMLCGAAANFTQLFLCRLGVGIGEAGGTAPAYALISETFPPSQRARALAVFALGVPIGSALGVFFGGFVASYFGWRWAFAIVGFAGIAFLPIFRLAVHDPVRAAERPTPPPVREVLRILAAKPSFWLLSFGAAFSAMMTYGLAFWWPLLLQRNFDMDLKTTSQIFGIALLIGGGGGVLLGGWLGDRLGTMKRAHYVTLPAYSFVIAVPVNAIAIMSDNSLLSAVMLIFCQALANMWLGPTLSAVQNLVAVEMRATASASFLLIANLAGLGGGVFILGRMSDALAPRFGSHSLQMSMLVSLVCFVFAAALMWIARRHLDRDWKEEAEPA
jgi:predicted MFS family arabinose efflux permease